MTYERKIALTIQVEPTNLLDAVIFGKIQYLRDTAITEPNGFKPDRDSPHSKESDARDGTMQLIRWVNEEVVAVARLVCSLVDPSLVWLERMAVTERLRGHNIGHIMMLVAAMVAREMGATKLALESVVLDPRVRQLYERIGFVSVGENEYNGTVYPVMEMPLYMEA